MSDSESEELGGEEGFRYKAEEMVHSTLAVFEGACVLCEAPYVGIQVSIKTPTNTLTCCPSCWDETVEAWPHLADIPKAIS